MKTKRSPLDKFLFPVIIIAILSSNLLAASAAQPVPTIKTPPVEIQSLNPPFPMPSLQRPRFPDRNFDIRDFGAREDGTTLNTEAFKKTILACSAAGGGMVIVPPGQWLTGAIHLKSNINLHLQEGAQLHFSDNPSDYLPVVFTRWAGFELYNYSPLIYARDCTNIAVTGPGQIFGHGRLWWNWKNIQSQTARRIYEEQVLKNIPPEKRIYGTPAAGLRPQLISPINCKHVLLEGFTIATPGPFWTFDLIYCDNVIVRGLHIHTTGGPNTDGINIDSSRNVLIEHCYINAGDDAVALKSGMNEDGRRVARPSENVVIRHITAYSCHGGIVVGSETSGGIRNIFAHDCDFVGADRGIRLKSNASRGGVVENLLFHDIKMKNIKYEALRINTNYTAYMASKNGKAYPVFRNITFKNITCDGAKDAIFMQGTSQEPLTNITLTNVSIKADHGISFAWVTDLKLQNINVTTTTGEPLISRNFHDIVNIP